MPRAHRAILTGPLDPNLTPLLDVVLQLIVFLLMLIHFGSRLEGVRRDIRLPVAPAALPTGELGSDLLFVGLDAEGRLLVADRPEPLEPPETDAWWAEQARQRHQAATLDKLGTEVVVRADRGARYGAVRRTLATAQTHGFHWFSVVVQRGVE
jgi:biopolymer transport protein ExbD